MSKELSWRQVRSMKRARGSNYASVCRDGRLILPRAVCDQAGIRPGVFVELFNAYDDFQQLWIAIEPKNQETAWTVKCTCTGKVEEWDNDQKGAKRMNCVVPLQTALSVEGIRLVRIRRVESAWDADKKRVLVRFGETSAVDCEAVVPA